MNTTDAKRTTFVIEEWTAVERNTLRGFCRVRLPSGLVFHDVGVARGSRPLVQRRHCRAS